MKRAKLFVVVLGVMVITLGFTVTGFAAGGLVVVDGEIDVQPTSPKVDQEFKIRGSLTFPLNGLVFDRVIMEVHGGDDYLTSVPRLEKCKLRKSDVEGIDAFLKCKITPVIMAMDHPGEKTVELFYWLPGMESPQPVTLPSGEPLTYVFEVRTTKAFQK